MLYATLKAIHYIALALLAGGPVSWLLVWPDGTRPGAAPSPVVDSLQRRIRLGMTAGALLLALSGLLDTLRSASQVVDLADLELVGLFVSRSRYGQMNLLKAFLAAALVVAFTRAARRGRVAAALAAGIPGVGILLAISLTSHAAARPGLLPVVADVIHLLAAALWGGGVLYLALLPWKPLQDASAQGAADLSRAVDRFSNLALAAVVGVALTGVFGSFLHVYGPVALTGTPYGIALVAKVALFALVLAVAGVNLLVIGPALRSVARDFDTARAARLYRRFGRLVRGEAVLLVGVLVLAGVLTTLPPADTPGEVAEGVWERAAGPWRLQLAMTPAGGQGAVDLHLRLQDAAGAVPPAGTRAQLRLRMLDHEMGTSLLDAEPVEPGYFKTRRLVSMAGRWRVEATVEPPGSQPASAAVDFEAATGSLERGKVRRFDLAAARFSRDRFTTFLQGGVLAALATLAIVASRRGKLPLWATPLGLVALGVGVYHVFSVTLVNAYPTTYVRNPVPYTPGAVARGRELFEANCAACHGLRARGDGPLAATLNPKPADLTDGHVDDHTDGDLFWWLTHGFPGSAMPGFGGRLTEEDRWALVNYVRVLRHPWLVQQPGAVPPRAGQELTPSPAVPGSPPAAGLRPPGPPAAGAGRP